MRFLRFLLVVLFLAPLTALFKLPGKMVDDFVIGKLTDATAGYLGMNTTTVAGALRYILPTLPFLAAVV